VTSIDHLDKTGEMSGTPKESLWRQMARFARVLLPPHSGWTVALGLSLIAFLWACSFPGVHFWAYLFGPLLFLAFAGSWLIGIIASAVSSYRRRARPERSWAARWLFAPILVTATVLLVATDAPFRLRFELGRSALDNWVRNEATHQANDNGYIPGQRIGTFDIDFATQTGDRLFLHDWEGGFFDDAGLAYLPDGIDLATTRLFEDPTFEHIDGPWYTFTASW